jgi:hypothetical protein
MRIRCRLLLAALLACAPVFAFAQAPACNLADPQKAAQAVGGYDSALRLFKNRSCLGAPDKDDAQVVKDFDKLLGRSNAADRRFDDPVAALQMLSGYAARRASGPRGEDWAAISAALRQSADVLGQVKKDTPKGEALDIAERALPKSWEDIESGAAGALLFHERTVQLLAPTGCKPTEPPCEAFTNAVEMIRVVNLAVRLRDVTQRESLALHLKDAQLQVARWEAYRSKGQHQYIWEVFINSLSMDDKLCEKDGGGIQRGFCAVPTNQWIVAHPEAGVRWVSSANQSSELKAAFLIEALGYYRWSWKSDTSAEMEKQFGASIVTAYTDVDTGRKWSWGPMFHFGSGYNIAFTKASGEKWGVLLNLNLADRYFGRKQEFTDYLKALKKPGIGELLQ